MTPPTTGSRITVLSKMRTNAQEIAALADQEWRQGIVAALSDGMSVADIAAAAGISKARVYQIRDGRR
jgi:AcrR family transcriptional regulator